MDKLKVLMLSWEYPPRVIGGLATHVKNLTDELRSIGVEITLLTCNYPGAPETEKLGNMTVRRVESYTAPTPDFASWIMLMNITMEREAVKTIKEWGRIDLVHAHDWLVAKPAISIKHLCRVPLISTVHSTEQGRRRGLHSDYHRMIHQIEWWLTYESWKVICCSNYMKEEVMRFFNTPPDKIAVISNGVDATRFERYNCSREFRSRYAVENERIVLYVGRLVPEKGTNVLLGAMPRVIRSHPEAKLVVVGEGYYKEELMRIASQINLSQKVYFTGYLDDDTLRSIYKCASVAVFPSLYEPFGIVALEAMASGVPVIVSNTGGLSEIVEHNVTGLKVEANNSEALSYAISYLLDNPDVAERLGHEALKKVKMMYNWRSVAERTKELYLKTLEEARDNPWKRGSLPSKYIKS
ncbi:MAG: glycosyltransferase family 4 protein [Thermoproteota archaeon]